MFEGVLVSVGMLKALGRQRDLKTTEIYIHIELQDLKEVIESAALVNRIE